jgi:hypothetical protein
MKLVIFKDYLGNNSKTGSPVSIKADDLDRNFKMCFLLPDDQGIYKISSTEQGSNLYFEAYGLAATWQEIDICVDGTPKKMMVLGTDPYENT